MSKTFSRDEVATHNKPEDVWVVIDAKVYDLSDFLDAHPGGEAAITSVAGSDVTTDFFGLHRYEVLKKYANLCIGTIENEKSEVIELGAGDLSPVPYAEPLWLRPMFHSPYYNDSHRKIQKLMRVHVQEVMIPEARRCEESGEYISQEFIDEAAKDGNLWLRLGAGKHLHGKTFYGDLKGEDIDYFHELVIISEGSKTSARGFQDGNLAGMVIGLPPVLNFAKPEIKQKVLDEVLSGKKKICLAISEAYAGSDALALRTRAEKQADGSWILNGSKKWITNGMFSDYFSVAAQTEFGITMFLVARGEGVTTQKIVTSYSTTAGTAHVFLDNVKVPASHVLGEEGMGGFILLSNFNHERWMMCVSSLSASRNAVEETLLWAVQRQIFKKRLIDQPVIRAKFAKLFALLETNQAWLELITYQMCKMSYKQQANALAGPISLLKMSITRAAHECADECVQIFGGRGLTKTGMGRNIEMFNRTYKFDAVLGGSEEILGDLGVRQALRKFPNVKL